MQIGVDEKEMFVRNGHCRTETIQCIRMFLLKLLIGLQRRIVDDHDFRLPIQQGVHDQSDEHRCNDRRRLDNSLVVDGSLTDQKSEIHSRGNTLFSNHPWIDSHCCLIIRIGINDDFEDIPFDQTVSQAFPHSPSELCVRRKLRILSLALVCLSPSVLKFSVLTPDDRSEGVRSSVRTLTCSVLVE